MPLDLQTILEFNITSTVNNSHTVEHLWAIRVSLGGRMFLVGGEILTNTMLIKTGG